MGFGSRGYNIIYAKNKMRIQDIPWITHTHTDCYDVCQIYNGQMPQFLWGDSFWDNHYYLIDKKRLENKEKYISNGEFNDIGDALYSKYKCAYGFIFLRLSFISSLCFC